MQSSNLGWYLVVVLNIFELQLYPLSLFVQYPTCLDLLEEKKINCEPLITHRFGFSEKDIITGFETAAAAGKTGAIKVMFNW